MEHPAPQAEESRQCCILSGEAALPSALLCFVISPDGKVVFDLKQNLPVEKRFWLAPTRSLLAQAMQQKAFGEAEYPQALPQEVERQLMVRMQETLSLLRRSGALVNGFDKVRSMLQQGRGAALVQAADASVAGREKLAKLASHHHMPVIDILPRHVLATITGHENQTHLLVMQGGLAERFLAESERLMRYLEADVPAKCT